MVFRPDTFGKYVLLKRIAIGGMAEVFRAKAFGAEGFEKVAAVKRMLPHLSSDNQFVDMFINEAKLAANLNHANIVQIYDFGCIDNLYFISMEYVHGKDIADIIRVLRERNLTTPLELACHAFIEVLNGLDYAHRLRDPYGKPLGLIHRDMSPHNVIVSYEGEVKLVDFGIAKAASSTVHTTGGVLKGKYSYMSPEQAHGMALDHRSDIFSLGICFYELLTLTKMFHAESDLGVLEKVRETDFPRPRDINDAIPEELEDILLKALEKNPDDRYDTAGDWRDDLERFLFTQNLHYSTSWLAGFMREIFRDELDREQDEFADEAEVVQKLRSQAKRAARLESSPLGGPDTVVIKKGGDEEEDDDEFENTALDEDPRHVQEFEGDTFTGESVPIPEGPFEDPEDDEPIEVSDDEVMEVDAVDGLEVLEDEEADEYQETAKMDRPDPALFRQIAGELEIKKGRKKRVTRSVPERSPIREVRAPDMEDTFTDSGIDTDEHERNNLRFLMDSTEPERSDSASMPLAMQDFDKDRSTVPEGSMTLGERGPSTSRGTSTFSTSSRGFPFGILFTVLLVAVVAGGVAAFFFHRNGEESGNEVDAGPNPAILGPVDGGDKVDASSAPVLPDKGPEPGAKIAVSEPIAKPDAGPVPEATGGDEGKPAESGDKADRVPEKKPEKKPEEKEQVKKPEKKPIKTSTRRKKKKKKRRRKKTIAQKTDKEESGFGTVDVGFSGGWAFVYVNGNKVRTTPLLNYKLKAGRHVVELKDADKKTIRTWKIRLKANGKVRLVHE